MKAQLDSKIVDLLSKKIGLAPSTIQKEISLLRPNYPNCTPNAVAQIFALQRGKSVWQKLSPEDRNSLPNIEMDRRKTIIKSKPTQKRGKQTKIIVEYETDDYYIKGHIKEINKAYTYGCYTSVFILTRKVIENLIIDILREKFPPTSIDNKELYYSINQRRFKDFSVILENLRNKKYDFELGKDKTIDRLYSRAVKFKDDANDATHSWYNLIETSAEIDDLGIQSLIELIKALKA